MSKLIYTSTDGERLRILRSFHDKMPVRQDEDAMFSEDQILKIEKYFSIFEKMKAYEDFLNIEREKQDKEFSDLFSKARIFVVHYYQSMSMAIERGELPVTVAGFYGLKYPFKSPSPKNGDELLQLAKTLFEGDAMRVGTGGKYFANPSIGAVKVWIEKFQEAWEQKTNKFNVKRAEVENIENIRKETDALIFDLHAYLDAQFEVIDYEEQVALFAEYCMNVEAGKNSRQVETKNVPDEIAEPECAKEHKSNSGTSSINQLRFDLFFPEN